MLVLMSCSTQCMFRCLLFLGSTSLKSLWVKSYSGKNNISTYKIKPISGICSQFHFWNELYCWQYSNIEWVFQVRSRTWKINILHPAILLFLHPLHVFITKSTFIFCVYSNLSLSFLDYIIHPIKNIPILSLIDWVGLIFGVRRRADKLERSQCLLDFNSSHPDNSNSYLSATATYAKTNVSFPRRNLLIKQSFFKVYFYWFVFFFCQNFSYNERYGERWMDTDNVNNLKQ